MFGCQPQRMRVLKSNWLCGREIWITLTKEKMGRSDARDKQVVEYLK